MSEDEGAQQQDKGLAEVVETFQTPLDPRAMGWLGEREGVVAAFVLARHTRERRRAVRERLVVQRLMLSRSVSGRGSEQAAGVARNPRIDESDNLLSKLLRPAQGGEKRDPLL